MRFHSFFLNLILTVFLLGAGSLPALAQTPVQDAQKYAEEAKKQKDKAGEAAKKLDCDKPKAVDKKALADAVNNTRAAAANAQKAADKAKAEADAASKAADKDPKNKKNQAAKEKAEQAASEAQAAADEAAAAYADAVANAPGIAAADAIEKELEGVDQKGNSGKKDALEKLKKTARETANANPCNPDEVKRAVRVELEKIKGKHKSNGEMRPWTESLEEKLKDKTLISLPSDSNAGQLVCTATGTGRTTGHIADLQVYNPTGLPATVELGPCFIPSGGQYQPYIVPTPVSVTVPPNTSANIPLHGYCSDIHTPPVPAGTDMPPVSHWITMGQTKGIAGITAVRPLAPGWQPSEMIGWQPSAPSASVIPTIPGTHVPLGHTIDPDVYPAEAAGVLLDAWNKISRAYDRLQQKGAITTPFSGNPEKERESVIQQTFWMYAAAITGSAYTSNDLRQNTIRQYETATSQKFNKASAAQREQVEQGVLDFWNTFQAVGQEAKVLKSVQN